MIMNILEREKKQEKVPFRKPLLFISLLAPCLFAATYTIHGPGDPQFKGTVDLSTAFCVTAHR